LLNIYVDNDTELKNKYIESIITRNKKRILNDDFIDAGFDLFVPLDTNVYQNPTTNVFKLDHKISCSAKMVTLNKYYNTGFYLYPRSSMSNTPFRLANSVGIIDAGYRGNIIAALDVSCDTCISSIEPYSRVVQICAPGLVPIIAQIVDTKDDLGTTTARGIGGFGSTGV
jgi:dUTP pyrophosphatase